MATPDVMSPPDRMKVQELCRRGQRGERLSVRESRFLAQMCERYPEEYKQAHNAAWNENAAALGSTRRI
jgi:hypothetical protein